MSTGQRLRQVKEDISRIERFLPVMKRVCVVCGATDQMEDHEGAVRHRALRIGGRAEGHRRERERAGSGAEEATA